MHILVADDDSFLRKVFSAELAKVGFTVTTASDGVQALAAMRSDPPDLVLLDALMPNINGFGVLKERHGAQELAKIPVIMLTSLDRPDDIEKAKALGATDFFQKTSLDIDALVGLVKKALPPRP